MVTWGQRGHGRSGRGHAERATVDQLDRDLRAVLDATTPYGPVVLAGHAMGGMTIMAPAEQHPGMFGGRIPAVALLGTSAEPVLAELCLPRTGAHALHRITPAALSLLHRASVLSGALRELTGALTALHGWTAW